MTNSGETQNLVKSPANTDLQEDANIFLGLSFGLAKNPTRPEYFSIAKYISMVLASSALVRSQILHDFLTPDLSKTVKYVGFGILIITICLFYRMLEKNGLLKEKYSHGRSDSTTYIDY